MYVTQLDICTLYAYIMTLDREGVALMAEDDFPNFFPRGSRPAKPGMFGGRRVPSLGGNGRLEASSTAWPLSASATRSSVNNDAGMLTQPASREPAAALPRRSALTGLSVTADQLEEWVKEINSTGGLDEPVPGPNTLNSDGDVRKALKHSAQDRGGPDTIEDLDLDDFADRFRQASRKLRLNGLQKNRVPEISSLLGAMTEARSSYSACMRSERKGSAVQPYLTMPSELGMATRGTSPSRLIWPIPAICMPPENRAL